MSDNFLPLYQNLIHVTRGENGEPVDWVGRFNGLPNGPVIEGVAYRAVLETDDPVLESVGGGYVTRLFSRSMVYQSLCLFPWVRRGDPDMYFTVYRKRIVIPCVRLCDITTDVLCDDPGFDRLPRVLVTLTPARLGDRATIAYSVAPE